LHLTILIRGADSGVKSAAHIILVQAFRTPVNSYSGRKIG
jgi:hypothetical protein